MSELLLRIGTDGAAFEDPGELPRLLRKLADQLEDLPGRPGVWDAGNVIDVNGNNVGEWNLR